MSFKYELKTSMSVLNLLQPSLKYTVYYLFKFEKILTAQVDFRAGTNNGLLSVFKHKIGGRGGERDGLRDGDVSKKKKCPLKQTTSKKSWIPAYNSSLNPTFINPPLGPSTFAHMNEILN